MDQATALQLVYEAIDTANELRRADDQIPRDPDVKLVGDGGRLDSLALATLLLSVERRVEDTNGAMIQLLDESADSIDDQLTEFETPNAIAALVVKKLAE